MVPPELLPLLLELPLLELLPACPHAVSAVSRTVAPPSASMTWRVAILRFMVCSPGVGPGARRRGRDPGGGRRPGRFEGSPGRLRGDGHFGELRGAAVGAAPAGEPPGDAAG